MPTIELKITGKVQGVFFRESTRQKASELGLTGWVRNEPDRTVTVRATGPAGALAQLESWCATGPKMAEVKEVMRTLLPDERFDGFTVKR